MPLFGRLRGVSRRVDPKDVDRLVNKMLRPSHFRGHADTAIL